MVSAVAALLLGACGGGGGGGISNPNPPTILKQAIVYSTRDATGHTDLYKVDADGTGSVLLAASADSSKFAFVVGCT